MRPDLDRSPQIWGDFQRVTRCLALEVACARAIRALRFEGTSGALAITCVSLRLWVTASSNAPSGRVHSTSALHPCRGPHSCYSNAGPYIDRRLGDAPSQRRCLWQERASLDLRSVTAKCRMARQNAEALQLVQMPVGPGGPRGRAPWPSWEVSSL